MISLDTIQLPDDLSWVDEFDWTPTKQSESFSLTGALIVETATKQAGRTITLFGSEEAGWITRGVLNQIYAKLSQSQAMVLTLNDARVINVRFSHNQKPIDARSIVDYATPDDNDFYSITLRFIAV